ncbi:MAG TPA: hypothetical protein VLA68_03665 [Nitrososphaera sp.]|nr:hypothetical protein [Nitrososphaera sp.]
MPTDIDHSHMIRSAENLGEKRTRPFCQASGCFDFADVYVVLKETEQADYYEVSQINGYSRTERTSALAFDGFKIILYFCCRHDDEFKYLIKGSELRISKRQHLCLPEMP